MLISTRPKVAISVHDRGLCRGPRKPGAIALCFAPSSCRTAVAGTRQRLFKFGLDQILDDSPHAGANTCFDRIKPIPKSSQLAQADECGVSHFAFTASHRDVAPAR